MIKFFYETIMTLGLPLIELLLLIRARRNKEDSNRLNERRGVSQLQRPKGELIWLHASSVGESMSALILVEKLLDTPKERSVLVTTGTITSARIMGERLPERAFHQFVPIDRPAWVRNFFSHWKPDLMVTMESEFWPVQLKQAHEKQIPIVVINGRLSEKSFSRWQLLGAVEQSIFKTLSLVIATNSEQGMNFSNLGAQNIFVSGNLKRSAPKLSLDTEIITKLSEEINDRPIWLAASTHEGEDLHVIRAQKKLLEKFPNLLCIIVPRHSSRGDDIESIGSKLGIRTARRTRGEKISPVTKLYIADTMGEMALFFHLARYVFVGGSLVPVGGHNPIEPAHFNCAIFFGTLMTKNQEVADEMISNKAAIRIKDASEIFTVLNELLDDEGKVKTLAKNALSYAENGTKVLDSILKCLQPFIDVNNEKNGS